MAIALTVLLEKKLRVWPHKPDKDHQNAKREDHDNFDH
jgi:hypothetical protein